MKRSRPRPGRLALVVVLAASVLAFAAFPFAIVAGRAWAVADAVRPADVVVVLGGGVTRPGVLPRNSTYRLHHAVELYRGGLAPRLLLTGGKNRNSQEFPAEAELMREVAHRLGVRREDIFVESRATRTFENGVEVSTIMRSHGWKEALLVTDAIHMRRATLVFRALGIRVHPSSSYTTELTPTSLSEGMALLERLGYEVLGTTVYRFRGWI